MGNWNVRDRNAGFADGQEQVWGFDTRTALSSLSFFAPGAKVFYVDPNNAQAIDFGNLGEDPTVPLATVTAAIVLCRAYMGDTIVVGANDAWQYAAGVRNTPIVESLVIPAAKGGIRIVGASPNPMACTWSAAADNEYAITVNATDVLIEGLCFYPLDTLANTSGIASYWDGATDYGENLTVRNCFFDTSLDYGIALDFSWYARIYNNHFDNVSVAAIHNLSVEGDPDYSQIYHNSFDDCAIAVDFPTTDFCYIFANRIHGTPAGVRNYFVIDDGGGSANLVSDNWFGCTLAQYAVTCEGGGNGAWVNNHCIDGDTVANAP